MKKILSILSAAVLAAGLLGSCKKDGPTRTIVVPEGFVDLGITNKDGKPLFWAKCNLGASNPQDYGRHFSWGDVTGNTHSGGCFSKPFSWDNDAFGENFEKVARDIACPDGILAPAYDAATGADADWRIPTADDINALVGGCVWIWTADYNGTGTSGFIVCKAKNNDDKGKADNGGVWKKWSGSRYGPASAVKGTYSISDTHIFLPTAGRGQLDDLCSEDYGYYWSSSIGTALASDARALIFHRQLIVPQDNSNRKDGYSIRPVTE